MLHHNPSAPGGVVWYAGQPLWSARAALVVVLLQEALGVGPVAAVVAGKVHPDPVHRAATLGEALHHAHNAMVPCHFTCVLGNIRHGRVSSHLHGWNPLGVWQVTIRIPTQGAGVGILIT